MKKIADDRGLTLIELCLTLLILGILVALATPRLAGTYQELKLRNTAERIADELRQLRQRALLTGEGWRFRVWEDGRGFSVDHLRPPESGATPAWYAAQMWEEVSRQSLGSGHEFVEPDPPPVWECRPDGRFGEMSIQVCNQNGSVYEIRVTHQGIVLRPAETDR